MCRVLPCSHAQQERRGSSVQARRLSFASEPLPEDLHHCGLQVAAAPKELLHLDRIKTTALQNIRPPRRLPLFCTQMHMHLESTDVQNTARNTSIIDTGI